MNAPRLFLWCILVLSLLINSTQAYKKENRKTYIVLAVILLIFMIALFIYKCNRACEIQQNKLNRQRSPA